MAWTALTFAFGSLLTSTKMTQLYDNITALANGDSGAPTIQNSAVAVGALHTRHFRDMEVGSCKILAFPDSVSSSSTYIKVSEARLSRGGAFTYRLRGSASAGTAYAKVYRNGVAVGSEHSFSISPSDAQSDSTSWTAGDLLQMYTRNSGGNGTSVTSFAVFVNSSALMTDMVYF